MYRKTRFIIVLFALASMLLSACGGAAATATPESQAAEAAGVKVLAVPAEYTGVVQAIDGTLWTVSGRTLDIDPSVVRDGPFQVGDTVKLEVIANPDGSVTVTRVEMPGPDDLSDLPDIGDDNANGNDNANENSNDANANDDDNVNGDDDNSNGDDDNSNDSNGNDDDNSNDDDDDDDDDNSNDDDGGGDNGGSGGGDDDDGGDDD